MALIINEEQQMLKESTKEFLDLKSPISSMRKLRDNNFQTYNKELWMEMVEMGWTALTIPEKYNGLNFGYVGLGQVLEEMGRKLTISPIISTVLMSTTLISLSKNEILNNGNSPLKNWSSPPKIIPGLIIVEFNKLFWMYCSLA